MTEYRYELLNHPKLICPNCGKKEFNGLVYKGTKNYVDPSKYGRCDRIDKCGYDLRPPTAERRDVPQPTIRKFPTAKKRYYMDEKVLEGLQKNSLIDSFSLSMKAMFDKESVKKVFDEYGVVCGSEKKPFINYTGFVYRDINGKFVSIKMFVYKNDLHRDKDVGSSWLHSWGENKPKDYEEFAQPWYGEQLISTTKYKYIGVVESEKTALICRILDDSVLWLACGGVGNIKHSAVKGLLDKKCIFYPDHDGWKNWKERFDEINKGNWRISQLPLEFTEKQDIADILLTDASFMLKIQEEYDELYDTVVTVEEEKYYKSLTKTYSEDDWNVILQTVGLTNYIAKIVKEDFVVGGKSIQRKDVVFYEKGNAKQRFEFAELFKDKFLDNFCTQKMIPKFTDIKKEHFSYNFEKHEFLAFLREYPKTFFNNYVFHLDDYSFYYKDLRFDITDIVGAKLVNLEKSSLNEEKEKVASSQKYRDAVTEFKSHYLITEGLPKADISLGIYEDVVERGRIFNERNGIQFIDDWLSIFSLIWKMERSTFNSLVVWCVANIRCRLMNDPSFMRTIALYGEGGTGKDYFLPSFLIGMWRKSHSDRIWENSSFGATGFSTETPDKIMTFLAQIISDDIEKVSASTRFDMITNDIMKIENKGQNVVNVRKRFLQIITNNSPRVLLDKRANEENRTALARRILLAPIVAISRNPKQREYQDNLFAFFSDKKHQDIFAGFWYSCFLLRDNDQYIKKLAQECFENTREKAADLNYLTEADDCIITVFERMCGEAVDDENGEFIGLRVGKKTVGDTTYYVLKNPNPIVEDLKNKFGKTKVKTALSSKYGTNIDLSKRMRFGATQIRVIAIPCDVIDKEEDTKPTEEELQKEPEVDIVASLCDRLWFPDNENPAHPLFAEADEKPQYVTAEMPDDEEVERLLDINRSLI